MEWYRCSGRVQFHSSNGRPKLSWSESALQEADQLPAKATETINSVGRQMMKTLTITKSKEMSFVDEIGEMLVIINYSEDRGQKDSDFRNRPTANLALAQSPPGDARI
ncbi:hypothetical protein PoB_007282600 [Plakobranchus ocellatus]|uniref:Uncharacterized protein n=1 Tax=Plakobranchus ocellatus TaxID=259542 RepID=A0AAV4DR36_9GAST|nr:hypothetical protein PoB_007282600 [Plakobranchus ocellatus]